MPRCGAGGDGVTEALAYITACLIDPGCVLEQSAAAAAMLEDDHDDHGSGSGAGKHIGLKVGMACAWFVLTVAASYLPLVFSFSRHYDVRLPLLPSPATSSAAPALGIVAGHVNRRCAVAASA